MNLYKHITVFFTVFLISYSIFAILLYYLVPEYYTFSQILFEASSAFNNVGQSTGITEPELNNGAKITMIIAMIVGRIELIPLYVLAFISFKRLKG